MPSSNFLQIPTVVHFALSLCPTRILDVGIGNGTYGFLLRQYLDISEQRLDRAQWQRRIDGVEVFEGLPQPRLEFCLRPGLHRRHPDNDGHTGNL